MKRITVIMPDEVYNNVLALAKEQKRSKSPMAAILIEDGLKFNKFKCDHMYEAVTDVRGMAGHAKCVKCGDIAL